MAKCPECSANLKAEYDDDNAEWFGQCPSDRYSYVKLPYCLRERMTEAAYTAAQKVLDEYEQTPDVS